MIIYIPEGLDEEYDSLMTNPLNKKSFPVFKNPEKSEIQELSKSTNAVRFLSHGGHMYAWDASVLHAHAIKHLGLPVTSNSPVNHVFMGVAKPNYDGSLSFKETNQNIKSPNDIKQYHSGVMHYFK